MQNEATLSTPTGTHEEGHRFIGARVLAHPLASRVGDFAVLFDDEPAEVGRALAIGRMIPTFRRPTGELTGPLASTRVTRSPLLITRERDGLVFSFAAASPVVEIDGIPLHGERRIGAAELEAGVVVLSGRDLALWIGWNDDSEPAPAIPGLIGESAVMRRLRQQIHRVADLDVPVLLRGATGVGKELVAAAIHKLSKRADASYVAVNVAGVPSSMAASELFGHRRGAFTGAFEERKGYFAEASGGTLFLDEIGDVSFDVQALLLRAVQEGVIQPLGGSTRQVDVRLVAATDSDLESAVARREFREPLLRRFSYEIHVPPLRARRDDIGLLFYHFLRERLATMKESHRLEPASADAEPFVPAAYVAALARHDWPGNVRELANVALKFAVENRGRARARIGDDLKDILGGPGTWVTRAEAAAPATPERSTREISDADILAALQFEGFRRERAARRLGVSKSYLYKRLENGTLAPAADRLPADEIRSALAASAGDFLVAAQRLRVSPRALKLQLKRLKVPPS
ncbi:MAG TPA: sigma 54-interacting transcriptional regulator [Polyangia bacterium]|jgi:two-component system nitrogen regulation response regulator GlnG|nr:sigma 54-interacting transcriptional regulator [Polyangia bacterium]